MSQAVSERKEAARAGCPDPHATHHSHAGDTPLAYSYA